MRRSDIPEALADPSIWPTVDVTALTAQRRDIYQRREQAICAYLRGEARIDIEQRLGVSRAALARLVGRCLSPHQDGRIQGLRALIPHTRAKDYQRVKPAARMPQRGMAGALGQLFERLPQLVGIIERQISSSALGLSGNNRIYGLNDVHSKIIAACREAGLTAGRSLESPGGGRQGTGSVSLRRRRSIARCSPSFGESKIPTKRAFQTTSSGL